MLVNYFVKYYSAMANDEQGESFVINTSNCDYYFMLYLDNELNDSEKLIVEEFLQNNPDQKELLEQMKNTILPNEHFSINKNTFYKNSEINANNVERFYLDYLDNELTEDIKENLFNYLQTNSVIANELAAFKATKIEPQTCVFNKSLLYKTSNAIFEKNNSISEILVTYLDGETTKEQNNIIENLIAQDENLQHEFALLKSIKLTPEAIIYPYKKSLYKKEKKDTPIIPIWLRYIAAACFLLFASWFVWINSNKNNGSTNDNAIKNIAKQKDNAPAIQENSPTIIQSKKEENVPKLNNVQINNFVSNVNNKIAKKEGNQILPNYTTTVKEGLNKNEVVTNLNVERKTNMPEELKNKIEQSQENTEVGLATNVTLAAFPNKVEAINNATNSMAQFASNTYIENEEVTNYTTTVMGIPTEKLVKKEALKKTKSRLASFIQNKLQNISNTSVSIGKYEIAFAK
jgi:hypothetical protein